MISILGSMPCILKGKPLFFIQLTALSTRSKCNFQMCHTRLMHCRCGKPYNFYILITLLLQTTHPKNHYTWSSIAIISSWLALTETNKQTFEMTDRNSENVIGNAAKLILECLEWLWVGKMCLNFKINNDF